MNTARGLSPVIDAYLDELDAASAHLPSDERHEILTSIADHISDRLSGRSHITDADARDVLRELGSVTEIVPPESPGEATTAPPPSTPVAPSGARPAGAHPSGVTGSSASVNNARIGVVLATVTTASMFFAAPLSLFTGLFAIGFGIVGLRRHEPNRGEAWAAIICGALPFVLMVVLALFAIPISGSVTVG